MVYISEKDCIAVLDSALKGKSFDVLDFVLQPFSDIMGFHGSHALLKVTARVGGKVRNFEFFVKLATKNPVAFERYFGRMKMFHKEHVVITKVMKELQSCIGKRLTSECFLSRLNKYMVLENLNDVKYEVIKRKEGLDLTHAKIAVRAFADLHASSIIFEENGFPIPEKFPDLLDESFFTRPQDEEDPETCVLVSCHKGVSKWAEINTPEIQSNLIKTAFEKVLERSEDIVKPSKKYRNVMCHGDPWGNNIMYKYDDEKPIEGILVDFQAVRYAPPAVDLMQFMYIALDEGLRKDEESELLDTYYSRLGDTLSSRGVDVEQVLPRDVFQETVDFYREFGVCARLYYTYITRIPPRFLGPAVTDVQVFLDLMIGGDPSIPLEAAEDPGYSSELRKAIQDAVFFYTGNKNTRPEVTASS